MSIRDLYEKTVSVELPDGTKVSLSRMTVRLWAKLAGELRDAAVSVEQKAIDTAIAAMPSKKPEDRVVAEQVRQNLRMRLSLFEPSYYSLLDDAQSAGGIEKIIPFAAKQAGTDPAIADELLDILTPNQVTLIMSEIVHAPLGPKIGAGVKDGQSTNPIDGGSSNPPTDTSATPPGSESPSTSSTGADSAGDSSVSTAEPTSTT